MVTSAKQDRPDSSGPARRRLAPGDRRLQLLDVAERILIERGSNKLTLEGLATEAGVTQPLLYHYFDGRDALLQALLQRAYARFDAEVGAVVAREDSFLGKVGQLARQAIEPLPSGRVVEIIRGAMSRSDTVDEAFQRQAVTTTMFVAQLLEDEYRFERSFAVVVAGMALTSTQGFQVSASFTSWSTDEATEVLVELLLGLFEGAAKMPQSGRPDRTATQSTRRGASRR